MAEMYSEEFMNRMGVQITANRLAKAGQVRRYRYVLKKDNDDV